MNRFESELTKYLNDCEKNTFGAENWESRRFGPYPFATVTGRLPVALKNMAKRLLGRPLTRERMLSLVRANQKNLEWTFDKLDPESQRLFIQVLAYQILGFQKVKLPTNTEAYLQKVGELEKESSASERISLGFKNWFLQRFDLRKHGYPFEVFDRPLGVYTQFLSQQYRLEGPSGTIDVRPGDTVVDAGACYGNTELRFAHKAGTQGKVYSFEFLPANLDIFDQNMAINPELASRIHVEKYPLWSSSGEVLYVHGKGPAARVLPHAGGADSLKVETISIDDFSERSAVPRIDFIKMDIEGAELEALKGAERVIRRDRPRLAICVYHKFEDLWVIPQWIDSLGLGYSFHLGHYTIFNEETVLYAEVKKDARTGS